ncbi:hypothetical protein HK414_22340 [Ramlibacter terrae]|uniref:Thiolase C-terminal domain-containing protein n=1 Tax=Ramlibacter terrae TaxID=2732511 RepID=A0ABX6P4W3_9BURK|nr:hypothetical protein HK414_22340 [Ramlibacter terrae]
MHPQLGDIARIHTLDLDPPPAEGACLLLLARADAALPLGLVPRARLVATASAGHLPLRGHEAAVFAFARALARAGWTRDELEMLEVSSPFAGVPLALGAALGIDGARINPDPGSWWFARAGAASSAIALMRLLRIPETSRRRRGALLCTGAAGQATVLWSSEATMIEAGTESIRVEIGDDRIATLTIDVPGRAANTMSSGFKAELCELVPRLRAVRSELAGVVITSAKKTFFAGGDLRTLLAVQPTDALGFFEGLERFKAGLRGLEQLGLPVAVAINGAALGGGWEICLCAHARFCLADDKLLLGLPEASLGLLPGAGGVTRMVRKLGLRKALPLLVEGRTFAPAQALARGPLDGTGPDLPSVMAQARARVLANPDPKVPRDAPGFAIPSLDADLQDVACNGPADLLASGHGLYPARQAVLSAAVEGAVVDVDTALRLESRYLASRPPDRWRRT